MKFPELESVDEDRARADSLARKVLESKAMRATFWTVMDYGCSMALRVVNSLILTRLLMPESFGLMTLVTTLIVGIGLISDIGLGPNVIQSPRGDEPALLNTVWTLQVLRGLGIFAVSLMLAWPMSLIYHEPRLLALLPALGINIVISSFNSTNLLSMSRHMGVRRIFLLDITTQLFTLLVTAGCALLYRSVWALVIGAILSTAFRLSFSFYRRLIPGIRNSFCWDRESLHGLVHFGKWILLSTAFYFFASQADRLILGRLVSFSMLGVYGIAYSVSDIPRAVINAFAQKVGYPFIARLVHLPLVEFRRVFLRYRLRALLAGAFLLCLMVHLGGFLVTRMYDRRYHAASWMVPVLALGLWHTLMYVLSWQVAVLGLRQRTILRHGGNGHSSCFPFLRYVWRRGCRGRGRFTAIFRDSDGSQPRGHLNMETRPAGNGNLFGSSGTGSRVANIHRWMTRLMGAESLHPHLALLTSGPLSISEPCDDHHY
jgi:O-antigen/teichoic acid export membrane protein